MNVDCDIESYFYKSICPTACYSNNKRPLLRRPIAPKIHTLPAIVSSVTAGPVGGAVSAGVLPLTGYLSGHRPNYFSNDFKVADKLPMSGKKARFLPQLVCVLVSRVIRHSSKTAHNGNDTMYWRTKLSEIKV